MLFRSPDASLFICYFAPNSGIVRSVQFLSLIHIFLGDAELKSIMSDGYNAYVFIGDELKSAQFKDTVHQVCMSHAKNLSLIHILCV